MLPISWYLLTVNKPAVKLLVNIKTSCPGFSYL